MSHKARPSPDPIPASSIILDRVLVLSASAGAGHVRAAQAIERALVATGRVARGPPRRHPPVHQPALPPPLLQGLPRHGQPRPRGARLALRLLRQALEARAPAPGARQAEHDAVRPAPRALPARLGGLHPLPARRDHLLARSKGRLATRQAIVVTDFDVQAMWLTRHFDHYFVALDETRAHLERWASRRPRSRCRGSRSTPSSRCRRTPAPCARSTGSRRTGPRSWSRPAGSASARSRP